MSVYVLVDDYNSFPNEFLPVRVVTKEVGASIGAVWRELLSDTSSAELVNRVTGFISRGKNIYALVSSLSGGYEDSFNLYSWLESKINFKLKGKLTPLNYSIIFGEGVLPRSSEEVLSELRSIKEATPNVAEVVGTVGVSPSEYGAEFGDSDDEATSLLLEGYFLLRDKVTGASYMVSEDDEEVVIGRGSQSTYKVLGKGVSRKHFKLRVAPSGKLELFDLGSKNGTKVDGVKVPTGVWVSLNVGSSIKVGRIKLTIDYMEE